MDSPNKPGAPAYTDSSGCGVQVWSRHAVSTCTAGHRMMAGGPSMTQTIPSRRWLSCRSHGRPHPWPHHLADGHSLLEGDTVYASSSCLFSPDSKIAVSYAMVTEALHVGTAAVGICRCPQTRLGTCPASVLLGGWYVLREAGVVSLIRERERSMCRARTRLELYVLRHAITCLLSTSVQPDVRWSCQLEGSLK